MPKTRTLKDLTKSRRFRLILSIAIILAALASGAFVAFAVKNNQQSQEAESVTSLNEPTQDSSSDKPIEDTDTSDANPVKTPASETAQPSQKYLFVDTANWVTKTSRDGFFSVNYIPSLVYSTCPDLADNLMVAMVGPTDSSMNCDTVQAAVSMQPYMGSSGTLVLRAETIIAQTNDVWPRNGAVPASVTLADGRAAQRYIYNSSIVGKNYHTIEYNTIVAGKSYVAINNWQDNKTPNMPVADFDTMIQKTWVFSE